MDKVRSEFEAWAKRQLWDTEWGEIEYGACGYLSDLTQGAWLLWQDKAALTSREGEAVGEIHDIDHHWIPVWTDGTPEPGTKLYAAPSARVAELEAELEAKVADNLARSRADRLLRRGLRARIAALEQQLAERDVEVFNLRANLSASVKASGQHIQWMLEATEKLAASREREGRMRELGFDDYAAILLRENHIAVMRDALEKMAKAKTNSHTHGWYIQLARDTLAALDAEKGEK